MPAELAAMDRLSASFLLALARVTGLFVFVPVPGTRNVPQLSRAAAAVVFTIALYPFWPAPQSLSGGSILARLAAELLAGVALGLAVAFITDALLFAMQLAGLQAGYSFASTFDPNSNADSTVLLVFAHLTAGLLFFAFGWHRDLIRVVAHSLQTAPSAGSTPGEALDLLRSGTAIFTAGVRLAAPVCVVLLMLEVALAVASRVNAQLQLLAIAFPIKMLAALAMLAITAERLPAVMGAIWKPALNSAMRYLGY